MLKHRTFNLMLALMLAGVLAACDESAEVLAPFASSEGTELDLAIDDDLTDAILADAVAALDANSDPLSFELLQSPAGMDRWPPDACGGCARVAVGGCARSNPGGPDGSGASSLDGARASAAGPPPDWLGSLHRP